MPNLVRKLKHHLKDTVYVHPFAGVNHRGENSFASPVAHEAFVIHRHKVIEFPSGTNAISRAEVYIIGDLTDVMPEDEIQLPNGDRFKALTVSHWTTAPWIVIEV